jgi:endonuclease YncB( thermonuclease family)
MKRLLFLMLLAGNVQANDYWKVPYFGAYDGDTIYTNLDLPEPLDKVSVRIYGIDTPEKGFRAECKKEAQLAEDAHAYLESLLKGQTFVYLSNVHWDKYGGRILAKVNIKEVEDDGTEYYVNVTPLLLEKGYAIEYYGDKKVHDWCK